MEGHSFNLYLSKTFQTVLSILVGWLWIETGDEGRGRDENTLTSPISLLKILKLRYVIYPFFRKKTTVINSCVSINRIILIYQMTLFISDLNENLTE